VEENLPARDRSAENPNIPEGHDYQYDEAHDVRAGQQVGAPAPHRVIPPKVDPGQGGDYGYDEAHDFGAP
jgi:hypothetical protein